MQNLKKVSIYLYILSLALPVVILGHDFASGIKFGIQMLLLGRLGWAEALALFVIWLSNLFYFFSFYISSKKLKLILSILALLFGISFLPRRFFSGYNKQPLVTDIWIGYYIWITSFAIICHYYFLLKNSNTEIERDSLENNN